MRSIIFPSLAVLFVAMPFVLKASPSRANPVHEIAVVAKQFAFEPAVIQVTAGEPVRLVIQSSDRVHGFRIRDLNIDVRIPRSGKAVVEFTAPRPGRYDVGCSEFCGSGHGDMRAVVVSVAAPPTAN
jgi:cytochrome c oxidase subunit 2